MEPTRPATETPRLLKAWRRENGLTQKQAAEALRTSERNIVRWESGSNTPRWSTIVKIAPRMRLEAEQFFPAPLEDGGPNRQEARLEAIEGALRAIQAELQTLTARLQLPDPQTCSEAARHRLEGTLELSPQDEQARKAS